MGNSLKYTFAHLYKNKDGAVALYSAVVIPLCVLLLFITVDTGRSYVVKAKAQEALDSALLGAVATRDTKDINIEFGQLFKANIESQYAGAKISNATVTKNSDEEYVAKANLTIPLSYRWYKQSDTLDFTVNNGVYAGLGISQDKEIEISLVLDNTGSMAGGKIIALKDASNALVNILFGPATMLDNLYVSVVPYDVVVRIGAGKEDWIQAASKTKYSSHGPSKGFAGNRRTDNMCAVKYTQPPYTYCPGSTCYPEYCYPAQPPYDYTTTTCDPETGKCTTTTYHSDGYPAWCQPAYCCVESQQPGYSYWYANPNCSPKNNLIDANDTPPTAGENWKFRLPYSEAGIEYVNSIPGYESIYQSNLAPMLYASNTKADIQAAINAMTISGATRTHVGLMWGWFTLSPKWQGLWDARSDLPKTLVGDREKIMVLMTDGKNYFPTDDPVTRQVCTAIKASGITLYTIGFGDKVDIDEVLLRNCATDSTKYFYAPSSEALESAFKQIGGSIVYPTIRLYK